MASTQTQTNYSFAYQMKANRYRVEWKQIEMAFYANCNLDTDSEEHSLSAVLWRGIHHRFHHGYFSLHNFILLIGSHVLHKDKMHPHSHPYFRRRLTLIKLSLERIQWLIVWMIDWLYIIVYTYLLIDRIKGY